MISRARRWRSGSRWRQPSGSTPSQPGMSGVVGRWGKVASSARTASVSSETPAAPYKVPKAMTVRAHG